MFSLLIYQAKQHGQTQLLESQIATLREELRDLRDTVNQNYATPGHRAFRQFYPIKLIKNIL